MIAIFSIRAFSAENFSNKKCSVLVYIYYQVKGNDGVNRLLTVRQVLPLGNCEGCQTGEQKDSEVYEGPNNHVFSLNTNLAMVVFFE